jgi:hypothetical protein
MQSSRASRRVKVSSMQMLPQPVSRLMSVLLIGLGAGLYSAAAPLPVILVALVAAIVTVGFVSARSLATSPVEATHDESTREVNDGRS